MKILLRLLATGGWLEAARKLEEILEQEGSVNPYQVMLLGPDPEETTPDHLFNIDMYESIGKNPGRVNTQNMEDWSVLSTEMCYGRPSSRPSQPHGDGL